MAGGSAFHLLRGNSIILTAHYQQICVATQVLILAFSMAPLAFRTNSLLHQSKAQPRQMPDDVERTAGRMNYTWQLVSKVEAEWEECLRHRQCATVAVAIAGLIVAVPVFRLRGDAVAVLTD